MERNFRVVEPPAPRPNWPLMFDNITWGDREEAVAFLRSNPPKLTQGEQVAAFEREFAAWLGVKHAVMVNSGSSANLITLAALRHLRGPGEVMVPAVTWVSDIAAVLHAGMTPRFIDIDRRTLGMDWNKAVRAVGPDTRVIFPTHLLGFDALHTRNADLQPFAGADLIEDCCEALGSTHGSRKCGAVGLASNFSFYYAHHMSTIEGGMICTNDAEFDDLCRMLRSHGMTREASPAARASHESAATWPEFTFALPGFNCRSTEINAVIGRNQLKRLDAGIAQRTHNLEAWLGNLDGKRYWTDYALAGSSNYALPLVLQEPDTGSMDRVIAVLTAGGVEYRRGTAGGGNQLRQPYARRLDLGDPAAFPVAEHVHRFGLYIGNYPGLKSTAIAALANRLNAA